MGCRARRPPSTALWVSHLAARARIVYAFASSVKKVSEWRMSGIDGMDESRCPADAQARGVCLTLKR